MIKDDLTALLPDFFQNIKEYPEAMKAWGQALETAEGNTARVNANLFVPTCDEKTAEYWETLLKITAPVGATLEDRRKTIMDTLSSTKIYTLKVMNKYINDVFGIYQVGWPPIVYPWTSFHFNAPPSFKLGLPSGRYNIRRFAELWWKVAPAHVFLQVAASASYWVNKHLYVGGACSQTIRYNIGG